MLRKILGSVREYKKLSIATPILEAMEVAMECVIPFLIARLVNEIKAGCGMAVILRYGGLLALMALLSLLFVRRPCGCELRPGELRACA